MDRQPVKYFQPNDTFYTVIYDVEIFKCVSEAVSRSAARTEDSVQDVLPFSPALFQLTAMRFAGLYIIFLKAY